MRSAATAISIRPKFADRLTEISMFFDGTSAVHQAMKNVALAFQSADIPYAIVGGMAVNAHRHSRTTKDVDFLISVGGWIKLRSLVAAGQFGTFPGRPRRFVDPETNVFFDILVTGGFPGSGEPGPIAYPDPLEVSAIVDDLRVIDLPNLIQLKLAAGRYQNFADVVNLIRENDLDKNFQQNLQASIRDDFIECMEEMRREDEYQRRHDANAGDPSL